MRWTTICAVFLALAGLVTCQRKLGTCYNYKPAKKRVQALADISRWELYTFAVYKAIT